MKYKQIETMKKILVVEKKSIESEIGLIVRRIKNKEDYIAKINIYKNDYLHLEKNKISKTIPTLYSNYDQFIIKINDLVSKEKIEINHLEFILQAKKSILLGVQKKLELLAHKATEIQNILENRKDEMNLQAVLDLYSQIKRNA